MFVQKYRKNNIIFIIATTNAEKNLITIYSTTKPFRVKGKTAYMCFNGDFCYLILINVKNVRRIYIFM